MSEVKAGDKKMGKNIAIEHLQSEISKLEKTITALCKLRDKARDRKQDTTPINDYIAELKENIEEYRKAVEILISRL